MSLRMVATGLLLLAMVAGCSKQQGFVEQSTEERLAAQYEFENKYIDVDDPD